MSKKMSLLEKAREIPIRRRGAEGVTVEEIELALAWMKDEITLTQIARVMNHKGPGTTVSRISILLREAYRKGMIREGK